MRRWLVLLLLAVLPVQLLWASAAGYESAGFGDAVMVQTATLADSETDAAHVAASDTAATPTDGCAPGETHCAHCHASAVPPRVIDPAPAPAPQRGGYPHFNRALALAHPSPDIERPKWAGHR